MSSAGQMKTHATKVRLRPTARDGKWEHTTSTAPDKETSVKTPHVAGNLRHQGALRNTSNPAADVPVTIIKPTVGWGRLKLNELWEFRELVFFFIWRDIKVRYKQTVLGAAWAILQPLLTMIVFSIFFGRLGRIPSDGVPYPLFALGGLVPWLFFMNGLSHGANSLIENERLIKKVFFPRMVAPISSVLSGLVDLAVAFCLIVVAMIYYEVAPPPQVILVPAFILLEVVAVTGVALWLSALNVQYRDVRYNVPFLGYLWLFTSPIAYPTSLLSANWQLVYAINPMVGVVEGMRWALLGAGNPPVGIFVVSSLVAVGMLVSGAFFFRRVERNFADVA